MTQASNPSRRQALKFLAGVPMLPMAGLGASSLLTACGGGGDNTDTTSATFVSATFTGMAAPSTASDMSTTSVGSKMTVKLSDGSTIDYTLGYETFFLTGTAVPDGSGGTMIAGGYYDINQNPIMDTSGSTPRQFFSDCPDGTSLLTVSNPTVSGITGKAVFAVVQFEYTSYNEGGASMYGQLPSPIAVLTLDQNQSTGKLSLVKYHNVDTSDANGLWITCGASLSPWGTHLSSEEYEPDAFLVASATANSTKTQFQAFSTNLYGNASTARPYNYGHLPEITVNPDGTGSVKKHYCLGRISHELVQVMPDNRTVLMGDDNTNAGYFVFVADRAKDLSAGTLYVAKLATPMTSLSTTTSIPLTWIKLGHATSNDIRAMAQSLAPTDIMDVKTSDPSDSSYTKIWLNGSAQWVKLVAGMEKAAAFLETHRYAALLGASMGFTKMEGTTVNAADKVAYSALSYCYKSMLSGNSANNPAYGVNLGTALNAGAVMALDLSGGLTDTDSNAIDSEWMPSGIKTLLTGEDLSVVDSLGNKANADKIANPDNLKFSEKLRTLFIGEDSGLHVNNFLWAYNVDTKALSRILSTPSGAESTGLHAVDDINGWTYIMSNFQHPGDTGNSAGTGSEGPGMISNTTLKTDVIAAVKANYADNFSAAVGYLTGTATALSLTRR